MEARRTMPEDQGHIKDPRFAPEMRRAEYLKKWGVWLRANKHYREPWMNGLIADMKSKAKPHG